MVLVRHKRRAFEEEVTFWQVMQVTAHHYVCRQRNSSQIMVDEDEIGSHWGVDQSRLEDGFVSAEVIKWPHAQIHNHLQKRKDKHAKQFLEMYQAGRAYVTEWVH